MKEFFGRRPNWFGICLIGGGFLAASGCDQLTSGENRFQTEVKRCEKVLTQLEPPVYSLKTFTDTCIKLEEGISSKQILAQFQDQADNEKSVGTTKFALGAASVVGALTIGFGGPTLAIITRARRKAEYEQEN